MTSIRPTIFPSIVCICAIVTACSTGRHDNALSLISVHTVDRNGFRETVTSRDRLNMYERTRFTNPQPYAKVARIYARTEEGKTPSKLTTYHDNGAIRQYLEVMNGRASGVYREWYPTGRLRMELTVIEGIGDLSEEAQAGWVFDGIGRVFNEEGNIKALFRYEKGALQGPTEYYFPDGGLEQRLYYDKGLLHGRTFLYNRRGNVIGTSEFVHGVPDGPSVFKGDSDRPPFRETYKEGKLEEAVYEDFSTNVVSRIENGSGQRAVFEEGYLNRLEEYRNGVPEGTVRLYNRQRCLQNLFHCKQGEKHGEEWVYYPAEPGMDPVPKLYITYVRGQMQGLTRTWFPDGALESEKEMRDNRKHGLSFARYRDGSLRLMEEYRSDVLVSGTYRKKGDRQPISSVEKGSGVVTLYDEDGGFVKQITYNKGRPVLDEP